MEPVEYRAVMSTGLDNKNFQCKIANIFLPINFNICFGCSKEMVLLSTHNICFGWEIRKLNFCYALLTKVLMRLLYLKGTSRKEALDDMKAV